MIYNLHAKTIIYHQHDYLLLKMRPIMFAAPRSIFVGSLKRYGGNSYLVPVKR